LPKLTALAAAHPTSHPTSEYKQLKSNIMNETDRIFKASEVKLTYKNKVKASDRYHIKGPNDAATIFLEIWDADTMDHIEEVKILLLNRAHHILGIATISKGGVTGSIIDTKVVLQYALKANATAIIMAHNHPSGNLKPSEADRRITDRLRTALEAIDVNLLDHIIINSDKEFEPIE